jgi:hypothetical protein
MTLRISVMVRACQPNVNPAVGRAQVQRLVGDTCRTRNDSRDPGFRFRCCASAASSSPAPGLATIVAQPCHSNTRDRFS